MTSKDINQLLSDEGTVDTFKSSIRYELENYALMMKKKGSIIHLGFQENESIQLDKLKFRKLLDIVVSGGLSNIHLAYICDCLTLAENLTVDETTKKVIFEIADPEINGGYKDKKN